MLLIKIYVYIFFNPKVMFQLFRILLKSLKSIMNLRVIIKVIYWNLEENLLQSR